MGLQSTLHILRSLLVAAVTPVKFKLMAWYKK